MQPKTSRVIVLSVLRALFPRLRPGSPTREQKEKGKAMCSVAR